MQPTTSPLYHYPDKNKPLAAAVVGVVHDDEGYDECLVHVGLAYGGGNVGDEGVPDEREVARTLALGQRHLDRRAGCLDSRDAMTFLLSDSVLRPYLSTAKLQHKNLEGCMRGAWVD